jgi:DNA-directed RNA polymerase specialized sigma24 family protein
MPNAGDVELLKSIDRTLSALLALEVNARLEANARAPKRSTERLLHAAGFSQGEIAALMGKSQQSVSRALASGEGKARSRAGSASETGGADG